MTNGWRAYRGPLVLAATLLLLWLTLNTFATLRHVFFFLTFAVVLSVVFRFPIDWLARWMPRGLATIVTILVFLALMVGIGWLVGPLVVQQACDLIDRAPAAFEMVGTWWERLSSRELPGGTGLPTSQIAERLRDEAGRLLGAAIPLALGTFTAVGQIMLALALAFFLAYRPSVYTDGIVLLFPPDREEAIRDVLTQTGDSLRRWVGGTLISMTIVGTATAVGLLIVGVESWFVLGVLSFFGEFIPFLGPVIAAVPGVAVALSQSPDTALMAAGVYLAVQQVESNLIQPLVMKRAVRLQPGVLLVWQLLFTAAFGFMGLLVATPLLAVTQAIIRTAYVRRTLGHSLPGEDEGHDQNRPVPPPGASALDRASVGTTK